ncbi:prepilin-type N-terminal cleavage/methylation domain-containing protein [Peptoclostridium litorale DSM 5388]|uniref:Prepilin-type N-terminal cleavage/methylation domain-containing protein n=1 Tax=Peptoclostridium litorale DSM 5388 TaxID=1121324 RepID=A0A069R9S4_PEPLI|nr:type II secretion system protein [Peptoclostridium litorale]KDR93819.1 hypothetical protein CLIT_23c00910 [Peptoclostridium litorale DSM 5388]SIN86489.1 prepilin-type N-terminal cleavage/methylation domain-containing protein [Peptoclostridium litorale DSM 5388]
MKSKGFTLIEVVLAVTILSLMGFAVLNLFMSATKTNNDVKRKIKASYIAQQIMEKEKAEKSKKPSEGEMKYYTADGVKIEVEDIGATSGYLAGVEYKKLERGDGDPGEMQGLYEVHIKVYFNGKQVESISSLSRKDKD